MKPPHKITVSFSLLAKMLSLLGVLICTTILQYNDVIILLTSLILCVNYYPLIRNFCIQQRKSGHNYPKEYTQVKM